MTALMEPDEEREDNSWRGLSNELVDAGLPQKLADMKLGAALNREDLETASRLWLHWCCRCGSDAGNSMAQFLSRVSAVLFPTCPEYLLQRASSKDAQAVAAALKDGRWWDLIEM